jgi:hypothetical protein
MNTKMNKVKIMFRRIQNARPALKPVTEFEKTLKKCPQLVPGTPDPYTPPAVK